MTPQTQPARFWRVHIREPRLPIDYAWVRIDVPEALVDEAPAADLDIQDDDACASWGTEWIRTEATPAVEVPSVIVPTERNMLLNSKHRSFAQIGFSAPKPFRFDPRLLKPGPVRAL
jgi:RES domain-containing protein